jgi:hypothetical protein
MDITSIKQALKGKSEAELREISDLLLSIQNLKSSSGPNRGFNLFCEVMALVVTKNDKVIMPIAVIVKQVPRREISEAVLCVDEFISRIVQGNVSIIERRAMYIKLLFLVREYLISRNVPVTYTTLVRNSSKVHDLFEISFPGYIDSGLGHWALKGSTV